MMRRMMALIAMLALLLPETSRSAVENARSFDGNWLATISCPNAAGALGYSYQFPTQIRDGVLRGEHLVAGRPGWLMLSGRIQQDGSADIYAKGLVGAPEYAPGQIPKGTEYGYHISARFNGSQRTGKRVEGRPCNADFVKQ
jgi:hypothetical protein